MFRKLVTIEEANRIIQENFQPKPVGVEMVSLVQAYDRVLAETVKAGLDIPPFDRSTVDGYAVKAEDTFEANEKKPVKLKVVGTANAGELPKAIVRRGFAVEIVTGAPVPIGADSILMIEDTERKGETVCVYSSVAKGENIMKAGSDLRRGAIVLKAGALLRSREIGVIAAVGLARVRAYVVPRVAILSTGAEVTEPGRKLPSGKIYDINAYSLNAAVLESGGKPEYLGVFPDDKDLLSKTMKKALANADIVITSGAVSVGPKDVMPEVLDSLGKPGVIVCGVAIKPGKPITIASANGKPVFSLPGHPTSALLTFHLLVKPVIASMAGRKLEGTQIAKALAGARMFSAKGRRTFLMVKLDHDSRGNLVAKPVGAGLSGAITTLANADGYVEIPEARQFVDENDEVTVKLFKPLEHVAA